MRKPASSTSELTSISTAAMAESVNRIKLALQWFPRTEFNIDRQLGKTQAILELIHDLHNGEAFYVAPNRELAEMAMCRYYQLVGMKLTRLAVSTDQRFLSAYQTSQLRGSNWPIYIDEWWMINEREQMDLIATCRVAGKVGTRR